MPTYCSPIIIKENMGKSIGHELSELSTTPQAPWVAREGGVTKRGHRGVPKRAEVLILEKLRTTPCDQCMAGGRDCIPQTKGGQPLEAWAGCFEWKVS